MSRTYVSNEDFVKAVLVAHKNGQSTKDVASSLGIEAATVNGRAAKLRKAGVPLPKLKTMQTKTDLEALAKMVNDYVAETSTEATKEEVVTQES
jgi:transposase